MTEILDRIKNPSMSNIRLNLIMIIAIIVWAFAFPFIKIGLEELSYINLTILRLAIVCISFIIIFIIKNNRFSKLNRTDILPIFILGFFGVIMYHLALNYGELSISPGLASLIIATIPIFVLIFAKIFIKEKLRKIKILGIIIAFLGVVIISLFGKGYISIEKTYIIGIIAVLFAAIMGAIYTIAGKKLLSRYDALSLTAYAILFGSLGLIPFLHPIINPLFFDQVTKLSNIGWIAVIFLGVFSTVIGYTLWFIALEKKSASELSVYLYAIPVLATLISYLLFADMITEFYIFGGSFVIIGLYLVNKKID
jgi:drug/metabolite transporter (DMT)-like permease